jgi:ribonuclease G
MSERNFSRRRRGGMRFRPSGGFNQKPDRSATEARADATGDKKPEGVFERSRHDEEIARAENIAAGLPPEGEPRPEAEGAPEQDPREKRGAFRKPNLETPAEVSEDKFEPVPVKSQPPTLIEKFKKVIKKFLPKQEEKMHKEIIINAESLETRIALQEAGRLEEFTIERTTEERLVGSIFKGKVRNLEDGLKAAFVDIGFEKNSFLHYWDIVPTSFDSGVEVVERGDKGRRDRPENPANAREGSPAPERSDNRRRDRPRITQKDIPRLYPPGSEIIVQVTKGPISTKGPRVTTNLVLPGRFLILLPNSDQSGISRKIENQEERQRLKKILREINLPDGMGVIMRTAGEGQLKRFFLLDLAILLEQWNEIQQKIKSQPPASCVFQEPDLIERTVRDFLTEDVSRVVVDSTQAYDRMRTMISRINPRAAKKIISTTSISRSSTASTSPASWRTRFRARSNCAAAVTLSSTKPRPWSPSTSTPAATRAAAITIRPL